MLDKEILETQSKDGHTSNIDLESTNNMFNIYRDEYNDNGNKMDHERD